MLLSALDRDSRQPLSKLSKSTRLGSDLVRYRIDKLRSQEAFIRCSAIIDWYRLNQCFFKVYLRVQRYSLIEKRIQRSLSKLPNLHWFARTYGKWDCIFTFRARDAVHAFTLIRQALRGLEHLVIAQEIITIISWTRFSNAFNLSATRRECRLGGEVSAYDTDPMEDRLISLLQQDARLPVVSLAQKLGVTPAIAEYRLRRLEELGIINGYRLHLNHRVLGLMLFKLCISLRNYGEGTYRKLHTFAKNESSAVCLIRQLGGWFAELELEVESQSELHRIIEALEKELGEELLSIDYLMIEDAYFFNRVEN